MSLEQRLRTVWPSGVIRYKAISDEEMYEAKTDVELWELMLKHEATGVFQLWAVCGSEALIFHSFEMYYGNVVPGS